MISIHAPREGSDGIPGLPDKIMLEFQSTLPVRGATEADGAFLRDILISIHAPREGSDALQRSRLCGQLVISIHAPREGSDRALAAKKLGMEISIHAPREGSDQARIAFILGAIHISIHAPREGSDVVGSGVRAVNGHFNPRSP